MCCVYCFQWLFIIIIVINISFCYAYHTTIFYFKFSSLKHIRPGVLRTCAARVCLCIPSCVSLCMLNWYGYMTCTRFCVGVVRMSWWRINGNETVGWSFANILLYMRINTCVRNITISHAASCPINSIVLGRFLFHFIYWRTNAHYILIYPFTRHGPHSGKHRRAQTHTHTHGEKKTFFVRCVSN